MMSASASGNVMNIWNTTDARELGVRFLASNKDDVAAKGKAFADYDVAISQGAGAKIGALACGYPPASRSLRWTAGW